MSSTNGFPIISELAPFTLGARSRRHHVILRRSKARLLELLQVKAELVFLQLKGDDAAKLECLQNLVRNIAFRVSEAIFELETSLSTAAKAEIAKGLQELKLEFEQTMAVVSEPLW
jgi:hypothetical protein